MKNELLFETLNLEFFWNFDTAYSATIFHLILIIIYASSVITDKLPIKIEQFIKCKIINDRQMLITFIKLPIENWYSDRLEQSDWGQINLNPWNHRADISAQAYLKPSKKWKKNVTELFLPNTL